MSWPERCHGQYDATLGDWIKTANAVKPQPAAQAETKTDAGSTASLFFLSLVRQPGKLGLGSGGLALHV